MLTKKAVLDREHCLLIEDGRPCANAVEQRGLCGRHVQYLRARGRLEEFAAPRVRAEDRRHRIELKPSPEPGICRLIVNARPCVKPAKRRGLCTRHYGTLHQRSDLDMNRFALPLRSVRDVRLRRRLIPGACRVRESGQACSEPMYARGLCRRHYRLKESEPALFAALAEPDPKAQRLSLRARPVPGRCRAAADGAGCGEAAHVRGLCAHHYQVLRKNPALLAEIAVPPRTRTGPVFDRRADATRMPSECVVVENGLPCSRPAQHRGVCAKHRRQLYESPAYDLADFYLPEPERSLARKTDAETADGLCEVLEDGAPCSTPPHARGLCRTHYRLAAERRILDAVARPPRTASTPFGAGNDRPHVYIDKNVLFDHADHATFGAVGQSASVRLVRQVMAGKVRASVSADAIKSTYNHLRHRLSRPTGEGGRGLAVDEADVIARAHIVATFYRTGAWRVIVLDGRVFERVAMTQGGTLSFEDALEYEAYQSASAGSAGPTMFVTRDTDFPEGVHPENVVRAYGW
ncbi:MAG: hypothetical protein K8T90_09000 [Planctomycetes bacterium]|nr:hypothetical protein [Planctomycetota bacterium]